MTIFATQAELLAAGVRAAWPVGSVFVSVVATNPATLLGFGTWSAFAAGRVLIGVDSGDASMDTAEETGGSKTHSHTVGTIAASAHSGAAVADHAAHTHSFTPAGTINAHTTAADSNTTGGTNKVTGPGTHTFTGSAGTTGDPGAALSHSVTQPATHTMSGSTATANGLPPFIAVYFWKRTA